MKSRVAASAVRVAGVGLTVYFGLPQLEAARVPLWRRGTIHPNYAAAPSSAVPHARRAAYAMLPADTLTSIVRRTCTPCHNDQKMVADVTFDAFNMNDATRTPALVEAMIHKLRAGMMPPPGRARPGGDTLQMVAAQLESAIDHAAAANPEAGSRIFQRLNRADYERSIRDMLTLQVDAGSWLPLDTKSANFDNIADVQMPSATTLDAYMDAAAAISRLAVGDPNASRTTSTYKLPRLASQWDRAEGAPMGTRGGLSVVHTFPADGQYVFSVLLHPSPTGQIYGGSAPFDEKLEVSVNGERVALLAIDRGMSQADPNGMTMKTDPVPVRAGAQRITAAFVRTYDGPVNDLIAPHGHSIGDTQIGTQSAITELAHLSEFAVTGPYNPTGVSETASRKRIFSCRPTSKVEMRPCAEQIINDLGGKAYRRPLNASDVKAIMAFYDSGAAEGGFELGIRTALEAILSSPHFIFRVEELPANAKPGQTVAINPIDLASRLSFFLWDMPPDDSLMAVAKSGKLADMNVLEAQAHRMLADPRSMALSTRFAGQWLRLQDIDKVHPDANQYPDYSEQLANDMRHETELFFNSIVHEDRSILDLFSADYTFVNEALADHYGIKGVVGNNFRRITYPDARRRGLLGQGSILTLTSHANRTSPVLRGKWVMEVLLGSPPPPPPPGVPDLEKTGEAKDGRMLTTRERMEMHRAAPTCRSCHLYMDPMGLALDNFDVTGAWRIRENGSPVDTRGELYDGTKITNLTELQQALLRRPIPLIRTFALNLMAYGTGRRVEYYDMPTVRKIVADAERDNYKMSDFVLGVVKSDAFRMTRVAASTAAAQSEK